MKIKNIKSKVAAKVAKGKEKVAAKCAGGKCTKACAALAAVAALALAGCGTTTPSRSQTLTFDDCTFNIYGGGEGPKTNDVARVEIGSQAMAIETSGTETQTATPSYTTDVKPDIDVSAPIKTPAGEVVDASADAPTGAARSDDLAFPPGGGATPKPRVSVLVVCGGAGMPGIAQ